MSALWQPRNAFPKYDVSGIHGAFCMGNMAEVKSDQHFFYEYIQDNSTGVAFPLLC